jgi:3-phosphoshikimate 1-carboxyvinyltransferase
MPSLKVSQGHFKSPISIPPSKSYANRLLILASIKPEKVSIRNLPQATDTVYLFKALKALGLEIKQTGETLTISDSFPSCEKTSLKIEVGEGGTTARFLAGLLSRGNLPHTLILGNKLKTRPWDEFIGFINHHGGRAELKDNELCIQGPLNLPSEVEVDCLRTTQFASALALAYPATIIKPVNLGSSLSYWEMTIDLIKTSQKQSEFLVGLDWSSASYPLAFGALNQPLFFPHLYPDHLQADSKFYDLLKGLGCLQECEGGLKVLPLEKFEHSITMDVSDCLDLVPSLAFFLAHLKATHELKGIENLIHKESNRLEEVLKLLEIFHRKAWVKENSLFIVGSEERISTAQSLIFPDDHRMVMTGTLFLLHHAGGEISPSQAVSKSFPEFFQNLATSAVL